MPTANKNGGELFGNAKTCWLAVILFLVAMWGTSCSRRPVIVPKLTPEPTHLRLVGKFVWFDLFTHDLNAAGRFYEALFGWSFNPIEPGRNAVRTITRQGIPIGNAIQINREKNKVRKSRWLGYVSVEDVDRSTKLVEQNNGTIYMPPKALPNRGRVAVVKDPQGAVFAMVTVSQ